MNCKTKNEENFLLKFKEELSSIFTLIPFEFDNRFTNKINLICNSCGYKASKTYYNIFKNKSCRRCSARIAANSRDNAKIYTREEFLKLLPEDFKYEVLTEGGIRSNNAVLIKDAYGVCKMIARDLIKGKKPGMLSAVDRNSYRIAIYRSIHGDNFSYPSFNYTTNNSSINILCNRCGREDTVIDCNHIKKKSGCKTCDTRIGAPLMTKELFNERIESLNNGIELLSEYLGYHKPILFRNKYGVCEIEAGSLLKGQTGSMHSAVDKTSYMKEQFKEKHNNYITYDRYVYCGNRCTGIMTCPIHGDFEQLTDVHLMGSSCTPCSFVGNRVHGFSRSKFKEAAKGRLCTLYIIECTSDSETFYKVGITSNTIVYRFKGNYELPYNYRVIDFIESFDSDFIWDSEKKLKRLFKTYYYKPQKFFKGRTECFTMDLPLDKFQKELKKC